MPRFLMRRSAVVSGSGRFMRLLALMMRMAGPCYGVSRTYGEHSQGQETPQLT
jgi:hypothetical protein